MAGRPKRFFTQPLGSGRSASLGESDPRVRRDANARVTQVPDPETGISSTLGVDELRLLIAQAISDPAAPGTGVPETKAPGDIVEENGAWAFGGVDDFFVSYGTNENWEAVRHTKTTNDRTASGQPGEKPRTVEQFRTKTYIPPDATER